MVVINENPLQNSTKIVFFRNFMLLLIALLMLGFLSFQVNKIATAGLGYYDDAYFASVAKNLALGHGYATSFHTIKKFDPLITTGPTIIIPAALFIKVFGNKYWVPSLAGSLIVSIMLFIVLWLPSKRGLSSINLRCYCLLVLLFIVCVLKGSGYLWFSLMGDVPSAFFAIAATMLLFSSNTQSVWRSLIAGFVAGAAFLTKTITAFNMIALLMLLPAWLFVINKDSLSWKKAQLYMVIFVAGLAFFPVSFEAYKKSSLSVQDYKALRVEARQHLYKGNSGIAQIQASASRFDYIKKTFRAHNRVFIDYTGGTFSYCILLAIILLTFAGSLGKSPLHFISYALLLSFLGQFTWWACLATQDWIRYLYQALIFLSVGLSILITQVKKPAFRLAIICLCVIFFVPRLDSLKTLVPTRWQKEERLTSLLKAADFIKINNHYSYVGAGWWAPRELEYILPGINNFKDYLKLTAQEEKEMKNIALVRDVSYWNWEKNVYLTKLTDACQKILFRSDPFIISLLGDSDWYRVDSASDCTDGNWVNGVARSRAAAFFVFSSFQARNELTVGKKITFADGTTRMIVSTKENEGSLIIFLDGDPLDGTVVGYPKKFTVQHDRK